MKRFLGIGVTIVMLASAGCAHPSPPPDTTAEQRGQSLLYVMPDTSGDGYRYVPIRIDGRSSVDGDLRSLLGEPLTIYRDGAPEAPTRITTFSPDAASGCTDINRITLNHAGGLLKAQGALVGTFSTNPNRRFTRQSANSKELSRLHPAIRRIIATRQPAHPVYGEMPDVTEGDEPSTPSADSIFTDNAKPGHQMALVLSTLHTESTDGATQMASLASVFERDGDTPYSATFSHLDIGCDDCESRPESYEYISHGDFDQDGRLDFLLSREAYETFDYVVLWNLGGHWKLQVLAGGGC